MKKQMTLKGIMKMNNMSVEKLAETIGITERAMSKKLNGHVDFKLQEEAKPIADLFESTIEDIFFNDKFLISENKINKKWNDKK